MATLLVYLTTTESGGETFFPLFKRDRSKLTEADHYPEIDYGPAFESNPK